jgi:hypothetical protein
MQMAGIESLLIDDRHRHIQTPAMVIKGYRRYYGRGYLYLSEKHCGVTRVCSVGPKGDKGKIPLTEPIRVDNE